MHPLEFTSSPSDVEQEVVHFESLGIQLEAELVLPRCRNTPPPVLLVSHGAGDQKENYHELADYLAGHV